LKGPNSAGIYFLSWSFAQIDTAEVLYRLSFILFQNFPELPANSPSPLFITFPLDAGLYAQRPVTQGRAAPKVCLPFQSHILYTQNKLKEIRFAILTAVIYRISSPEKNVVFRTCKTAINFHCDGVNDVELMSRLTF